MAKNIEINLRDSAGSYEILYPKTLGSLIEGEVPLANSASTISTTLPVSKGGTGGTTVSSGVYNLVNPLTQRTASQVNSYASSTYIPCVYSTSGYKMPISNMMTYINNNVSKSVIVETGSYVGNGTLTSKNSTQMSITFSKIDYPDIFILANADMANKIVSFDSYRSNTVGNKTYDSFDGEDNIWIQNGERGSGERFYNVYGTGNAGTTTYRCILGVKFKFSVNSVKWGHYLNVSGDMTQVSCCSTAIFNKSSTTYNWTAIQFV